MLLLLLLSLSVGLPGAAAAAAIAATGRSSLLLSFDILPSSSWWM